jgi:hypothetical protein
LALGGRAVLYTLRQGNEEWMELFDFWTPKPTNLMVRVYR